MIIALGVALSLTAADPLTTRFEEIDFASGSRRQIDLTYAPVANLTGNIGRLEGERLQLPQTGPVPSYLNSRFSTIYRARDVAEISRYPARAVAKLYRLNADGSRSPAACTAQFVGPRHLITAGHCIVDINSGTPHAAFEIAVQFDEGTARGGMAKVTRAWIASDQMKLADPSHALVTPERCGDLATIEIAEPIGERVGWLGLRDLDPGRPGSKDELLHRFAYPHVSAARNSAAAIANAPPEARAQLEAHFAQLRRTEPDFSPDNLYYEFGQPDEAQGRYIAYRTPYSAPGRSGSALIDGQAHVVALASRGYSGTFYSCRLTARDIGAVQALIARAGKT